MMTWHAVAKFELHMDLHRLNDWLESRAILHRITEEQGVQVLWIGGDEHACQVSEMFTANPTWFETLGETENSDSADLTNPQGILTPSTSLVATFIKAPITLVIILLGVLGALLVTFDSASFSLVRHLTFQNFFITPAKQVALFSAQEAFKAGEYWRLITPVFLHFGAMHIIFNGLWVWEFGRRIESSLGSWRYISLFLMLAVVSNSVQYIWQGPSLFGGLSGVVYGLLGFLWMRQRFYPHTINPITPGIIGFMLVWLVVCMTGLIDNFIAGSVANAAHAAGLVMGVIVGVIPLGIKPRRPD